MITPQGAGSGSDDSVSESNDPGLGIALILAAALVGAFQYAFEERAMKMEIAAPPLFLIGMEGLWGCVVCIFIMYPQAIPPMLRAAALICTARVAGASASCD